jgi:hypothetical protein
VRVRWRSWVRVPVKDTLLRRWEEGLIEGIELFGPDSPAGRRLEETRAFFAFIRTELPRMLERWREQRRACAISRPDGSVEAGASDDVPVAGVEP